MRFSLPSAILILTIWENVAIYAKEQEPQPPIWLTTNPALRRMKPFFAGAERQSLGTKAYNHRNESPALVTKKHSEKPKKKPKRKKPFKESQWRQTISSTISNEDKAKLRAIAIVFPQYHAIPENDRFWGKGFTEWTMLRPTPRLVNDITTRFPHEDVGYYNILDFDHRLYMRIMADHFGVYGFCFYHYWFKDRPIMQRPLELLLKDGEPDKPFFFTWANEAWSNRWDGRDDQVLLAQDYSDVNGNIAHFQFLLPYFRHKNYIHVNGCPLFAFYRIDKEDATKIDAIMKLWQKLAVDAGLKGIFFLRFLGSFKNKVQLQSVQGHIQFEPLLSWVRSGGGPGIFNNGTFDKNAFLANNKDLLKRNLDPEAHYIKEGEMERSYRTSQFKMHDKSMTWRAIEKKQFNQHVNTFRGTYCHWSNHPRRNFTNGDYVNYPHMMTPDTIAGCQAHLEKMGQLVLRDPANRQIEKYIFLTAWNEWNEQSVFEPTDVDGYDALAAVKFAMRVHTGLKVHHVCHRGGGTEHYIYDLAALFNQYEHVFIPWKLPEPDANTTLLHIHSAMVGETAVQWDILPYIRQNKAMGIRVCVTVHDLQWFYPDDPNPSLEVILSKSPEKLHKENTFTMLALADVVIFPSTFLKNVYFDMLYGKSIPTNQDKYKVALHNDFLIKNERLKVPLVTHKTVHIAYLGNFLPPKGSDIFLSMASQMKESLFASDSGSQISLQFHVFGGVQKNENCVAKYCSPGSDEGSGEGINFHGYYTDATLPALLEQFNIHIILYLSLETYCYALTHGINTGLPIVYLNRGALAERLDASNYERYFPLSDPLEIKAVMSKAVRFVITHQGVMENFYNISNKLQPTKWYLMNYPTPPHMSI